MRSVTHIIFLEYRVQITEYNSMRSVTYIIFLEYRVQITEYNSVRSVTHIIFCMLFFVSELLPASFLDSSCTLDSGLCTLIQRFVHLFSSVLTVAHCEDYGCTTANDVAASIEHGD